MLFVLPLQIGKVEPDVVGDLLNVDFPLEIFLNKQVCFLDIGEEFGGVLFETFGDFRKEVGLRNQRRTRLFEGFHAVGQQQNELLEYALYL